MRESGLGALLIHTSFARPSAVAWLTHFVPYWNEGLLVVLPTGAPTLLAAFSKRMHDWIRSVSHVGEVRSVPQLGRAAADLLEGLAGSPRIGVLELDALPWPVAEPLASSRLGTALVDATGLFASIRQPADDAEIRLAQRAADIAAKALAAIPADAKRASQVLSAIERSARLAGAEEVLPRLAPDLTLDATLRRFEGDALLGERYAVGVSVAYKAAWTRLLRCFAARTPRSWVDAQRRMAAWASRLSEATLSPQAADAAFWSVEACIGSEPLSVVASSDGAHRTVRAGTLACVSLRLDLPDGPWLGAGPAVIGGRA